MTTKRSNEGHAHFLFFGRVLFVLLGDVTVCSGRRWDGITLEVVIMVVVDGWL